MPSSAISHVIRGEDHVSNTALQLAILPGAGLAAPAVRASAADRRCRRAQLLQAAGCSVSLRSLREQGIEPLAIVQTLAALGTPMAAPTRRSGLDAAGRRLRARGLWPGGAQVDRRRPAALLGRRAAPPAVRGRRATAARAGPGRDRCRASGRPFAATSPGSRRPATWWEVCSRPLRADHDRPRPCSAAAADLLPAGSRRRGRLHRLDRGLKAATGLKGKALFQPLRLALTGREHGPELKHLLPLLGRERALARLRGETA